MYYTNNSTKGMEPSNKLPENRTAYFESFFLHFFLRILGFHSHRGDVHVMCLEGEWYI